MPTLPTQLRGLGVILLAASLVLVEPGTQAAYAQTAEGLPRTTSGTSSEENAALLDSIRNDALGIDGRTIPGPVIVIAHLGKGEVSRTVVLRRLHNVHQYLSRYLPRNRLIVAEGERLNGKGSVEFYQGGKLLWVCLIDRRRDMRVDCCGEFPQYYPWYKGGPKVRL